MLHVCHKKSILRIGGYKRVRWLTEIQKKYSAAIAHVFLLHFNVSDVVQGALSVTDCLLQLPLFKERDIVLHYNRSGGIQFFYEHHKQRFFDALGLDVPTPEEMDEALALQVPREPEGALGLLERLLKMPKVYEDGVVVTDQSGNPIPRVGLIIDYADMLVPDGEVSTMSPGDRYVLNTILRWAKELAYLGAPVVLLAENIGDVHPALRSSSSRIEAVRVPLPDLEKRHEHIETQLREMGVALEGLDVERAARLTAALRLVHIEDIILRCDVEGEPLTEAAIKWRKKEIVASEFADLLEIIEPEDNLGIGGMEHLIEMLNKNVVEPIKNGSYARVPMGILFAGPPGTGKTLFAKYLAKATGFNCVALNMSRITDKWVGSSERNLRRAFECFEALAPTVVVIDEIDQMGLSRESSGDSGVGNRQFKMLLEYMSDTSHRGKILFIGLTNRPDLMDPALKRAGRFDRIVPVLPPEREQRAGIFEAIFGRYDIKHDMADFMNVAGMTEDYTGADIEAVVLRAFEKAQNDGRNCVTEADLQYVISMYRLNRASQEMYIRLALQECKFIDDLPPRYRERALAAMEGNGEPQELRPALRRRRE